jgi:monoterpene epsilon-lactone hydrolase
MSATSVSPEFTAVIEMVRQLGINDPSKSIDEVKAMLSIDAEAPPGVDVQPVDAGGVAAELLTAEGASRDRVVVHFHGGAYIAGGLGSHRAFAAKLSAATGSTVLLVDYRLAPEDPFPAALDDAVAAYRWVIGEGLGVHPNAVVVSGDSAGGGLTAALLPVLRDEGTPLPGAAVLLSPWTDLACSGASHATEGERDPFCSTGMLAQAAVAYASDAPLTDPRISPLYADLSGLPPVLVHVGECEVLRDDAVVFARRAADAGTPVELYIGPNMVHVWHLFTDVAPESTRDFAAVAAWITERHETGLRA